MNRIWNAIWVAVLWVAVFGPFMFGMAVLFTMSQHSISSAVNTPVWP